MRKLFRALVGIVLLSSPALAQKMGSINRNAPSVATTITFGGKQSIELSYIAISWGEGNWAKAIAEKNTQMRDSINAQAGKQPLGSLTLPADMMLGGKQVMAGKYKLAFTLSEAFAWELTLTGDKDKHTWPLTLEDADKELKRLTLGLIAGEADLSATLHIAFGTKRGEVAIGGTQTN